MVSVIYLNYNRINDLYRSLKEIYKQDMENFEVIVIDQNSNDGSIIMIEENYPRVKLIKLNTNLGVAGGRNYGAKVAQGDYLIFIDDDAELLDYSALRRINLIFINNPNVNIIAFNIVGHPEIKEKTKYFSLKKDKKTNFYIGCGHAIRKSIYLKLGGYSESLYFWGEEIELATKAFYIHKNIILFKGDILLYHRISPTQRLNWKDGRFYYKVRNRLSIIYQLFPKPLIPFYLIYFICAYFIRAIQLNLFSDYIKAIKDFKNVAIANSFKISIKSWARMFFTGLLN